MYPGYGKTLIVQGEIPLFYFGFWLLAVGQSYLIRSALNSASVPLNTLKSMYSLMPPTLA